MRKNTPTQNPTLADLYTEIKAVKTEVHEINIKVVNLDKKIDQVENNLITEFSNQIRDVLELVDDRLQPLEKTKVGAQ